MEDALTTAIRLIVREEVEQAVEKLRASITPPSPVGVATVARSLQTDSCPELLFVEEVAAILRRSPAQLRWMIHNGTAPHHAKIGGRVIFKEQDVYRYIEDAFASND